MCESYVSIVSDMESTVSFSYLHMGRVISIYIYIYMSVYEMAAGHKRRGCYLSSWR